MGSEKTCTARLFGPAFSPHNCGRRPTWASTRRHGRRRMRLSPIASGVEGDPRTPRGVRCLRLRPRRVSWHRELPWRRCSGTNPRTRASILAGALAPVPLSAGVDVPAIAARSGGYTGDDIGEVVGFASVLARTVRAPRSRAWSEADLFRPQTEVCREPPQSASQVRLWASPTRMFSGPRT